MFVEGLVALLLLGILAYILPEWAARQDGTKDEGVRRLSHVANILGVSEFHVFGMAYAIAHNVPLTEDLVPIVGASFKKYLHQGVVPVWVWQFVFIVLQEDEQEILDPNTYLKLLNV